MYVWIPPYLRLSSAHCHYRRHHLTSTTLSNCRRHYWFKRTNSHIGDALTRRQMSHHRRERYVCDSVRTQVLAGCCEKPGQLATKWTLSVCTTKCVLSVSSCDNLSQSSFTEPHNRHHRNVQQQQNHHLSARNVRADDNDTVVGRSSMYRCVCVCARV
jgi:hypothetical protein